MKLFSSFILSLCTVMGFSQTILYQAESTSRTVQDPQTVILTPGFHATSSISNPFVAKIGPSTDNPGGGPADSNAGASNPYGTTETANTKFHDTKGNIEVDGSGQLKFTLPLTLPAGVKNIAPEVNLVYNSSAGNGIAGYGWNISGINSIVRTGKNIEKDGETKGVQFDYSDYYSFNGQRLILKSGEYGKDGAEYVTEKYSNIKIRSIGSETAGQAFQGPEYWEVTFEDGSRALYGSNLDARTSLEFNITEWQDPQGNYISYSYAQEEGVSKIYFIKWGGNKILNKPHFNTVLFDYNVDRNLKEQSYIRGLKYTQKRLLSEIKVFSSSTIYNNAPFRKYTIEYTNNGTNYQFVNKITEYNADGQPANPITIDYPPMVNSSYAEYPTDPDPFDQVKLTGDFNGDSYLDFLMNDGTVKLGAFNENFSSIATGKIFANNAKVVSSLLDEDGEVYNGNGIVEYKNDRILGYILRNNTFVKVFDRALSLGSTDDITSLNVGDFNGDGMPDLFVDDGEQGPYNQRAIVDLKYPSTGFSYITSSINENSYTDQKYMDIDGDGKVEIINVEGSQYTVFEFVKVSANQYEKKIRFSGNLLETKDAEFPVLYGDFNGDGNVDFAIPITDYAVGKPDDWRFYMGTGKGFLPFLKKEFFTYRKYQKEMNGNYAKFAKQYFFSVTDMNRDGKSDIVQVFSYNQVNPYNASGYRDFGYIVSAKMANGSEINGTPNFTPNWSFQSPVYGTPDITDLTLFAPLTSAIKSGNNYYNVFLYWKQFVKKIKGPTSVFELAKIASIKQGGVTTLIKYQEVVPDNGTNPGFYKKVKKEIYPYYALSRADQVYAVSQLEQENRKQDFRYRSMTGHMRGKGMMGYLQAARSSWYADGFENTKIWNGVELDPLQEGVPVKEWSIRTNNENQVFPADISENNTQLLSFKSTIYQIDKLVNGQVVSMVSDADKPKAVIAILPKIVRIKDFLTNTVTTNTVDYGEYYLPEESVSNINDGYATTVSNFGYIHNPAGVGADYYIGRPQVKNDVIDAYSDSQSVREEYTYENNLLKTLTKWNRDNSDYLRETYDYDGFGNKIQTVISNGMDAQTETSKAGYDSKGRFVEKAIDNLGLVNNYTYNDLGQVLTNISPLGNNIINTYDAWNKIIKSKSNLEGTTTYTYQIDDNYNTFVTAYDPDGDISKKYTNKLNQDYKTSTKAFGQGKFVSKEAQYDLLGRKVQESEAYFEGQSASQWNTTVYDDTVFPAKVTSSLFSGKQLETSINGNVTTIKETNPADYGRIKTQTVDALDNIIASTDEGGTITFGYNAVGEQITSQYAGSQVITKYDAWGRKSEFNDPSNGVYTYEYNSFGQPLKVVSPKGTKEYAYNSSGQLISQKEFSTADGGQTTDKMISFSYDNKGRLIARGGTSKGKAFSSNIIFDPQGRILSSSESSNGKYFIQKGITYDDKARVISYEKQLYSSGTLTKVDIENIYSSWNGELAQVKDKNSGKVLWELKETNSRGQVLTAQLGSSDISNTYNDATGYLTGIKHVSPLQGILSIKYSFNAIKNELKLRTTLGDFNIIESFDYDTNNRLTNWTNPKTGQNSENIYDVTGRIMKNDQVGTMKYENSAKIYQPTGMTLNTAGEQNYNNDLIQTIVYNENNDPVFIDGMKGDVAFQYGLTSMRQRVTYGGNFSPDGDGKFTKFYNEDGSFEIVRDNVTGKEKHLLYIGGNPYESNIVYLKNFDETNGSYRFLHKDYLGSILAITDEAGNKLEQRHFDAWGNFTHLQIGNGAIITDKNIIDSTSLLVDRGYTSHEHFAEVGLIHMNGRLYDPLLRRFLNADENIQDIFNTQVYNKYGYVLNNPLIYSDPNGEFAWIIVGAVVGAYMTGVKANGSWDPTQWNWGATWGKILVGGIVGAAGVYIAPAIGASALAAAPASWGITGGVLGGAISGAAVGAVAGALTGFTNAVMFGENVIKGTLMGAGSGALTGGVIGGVAGGIRQIINNARGLEPGTILKGAPIAEGRSAWTLNNTPKMTTVGLSEKVGSSGIKYNIQVGEADGEFIRQSNNAKQISTSNCLDCENPRFIFDSKGRGLDMNYFNSLSENSNSSIISGGSGGQNIVKMTGPPNSYTNLNNGHIVVYGPEGKPIFDVNSVRIKGIFYNTTPSGKVIPSFGKGTKFDGPTPKALIKFFGL